MFHVILAPAASKVIVNSLVFINFYKSFVLARTISFSVAVTSIDVFSVNLLAVSFTTANAFEVSWLGKLQYFQNSFF